MRADVELVILQAVAHVIVVERLCTWIELGQPLVCAHPQVALQIGLDAIDDVVGQPVLLRVVGERPCSGIEAVQAAAPRADPHRSIDTLVECEHVVVAQTLRIVGVVQVARELTRIGVPYVHATQGAHPQLARRILVQRPHPVATQAGGVTLVVLIADKGLCIPVEPVEPARPRPDPQVAVTIFE